MKITRNQTALLILLSYMSLCCLNCFALGEHQDKEASLAQLKPIPPIESEQKDETLPQTSESLGSSKNRRISRFRTQGVARGRPGQSLNCLWPNHSTLKVLFLDGEAALQDKVMKTAQEWTQYGAIKLERVNTTPADIRITFKEKTQSWSKLGTCHKADQSQPTLCLGKLRPDTSSRRFRQAVLHEFGHAFGLNHEMQNPLAQIQWDLDAVYAYYQEKFDMDKESVDFQILNAPSGPFSYSNYDPASIMNYPIVPGLTRNGYTLGINYELSGMDKAFFGRIYPFNSTGGFDANGYTNVTAISSASSIYATHPLLPICTLAAWLFKRCFFR